MKKIVEHVSGNDFCTVVTPNVNPVPTHQTSRLSVHPGKILQGVPSKYLISQVIVFQPTKGFIIGYCASIYKGFSSDFYCRSSV